MPSTTSSIAPPASFAELIEVARREEWCVRVGCTTCGALPFRKALRQILRQDVVAGLRAMTQRFLAENSEMFRLIIWETSAFGYGGELLEPLAGTPAAEQLQANIDYQNRKDEKRRAYAASQTPEAIAERRAKKKITDPDEIPEVPVVPVSQPGDIWILGNHRLICGDSTDALIVEKLLGAVKPHLMVTDPPYGVQYDPEWRERAGVNTATAAKGKVLNDDRADWREAWALFPGDVAYVWHAGLFAGTVADSLVASGFQLRSQIVWDKGQLVLSRGDYHWQHEPCWYAVKKSAKGHWTGDRKQTTVWDIPKPKKSETGHGTQKPVECMKRPIENNSSPGQAIYEPFSGSGTTIIAGEMTGRHVYAIELNPAYVDVAVKRWQEFTGRSAVHAETGSIFAGQGIDTESLN